MKKRKKAALTAVLLTVLLGGMMIAGMGYDAGEDAAFIMKNGETRGRVTAFWPEGEVTTGLIFYPGGLVDHAAYAPLMQEIADWGMLALLVEMPLDLAVFDMDAAKEITAEYPQVQRFLIGGHSLGGAMAAAHAAKHPEDYDGLVLLGAYAAEDLSETGIRTLSIYGSEDGVMNREKYETNKSNLPAEFEEIVIPGGNHALFGDYGKQKGDGQAQIFAKEQRQIAAQAIARM